MKGDARRLNLVAEAINDTHNPRFWFPLSARYAAAERVLEALEEDRSQANPLVRGTTAKVGLRKPEPPVVDEEWTKINKFFENLGIAMQEWQKSVFAQHLMRSEINALRIDEWRKS